MRVIPKASDQRKSGRRSFEHDQGAALTLPSPSGRGGHEAPVRAHMASRILRVQNKRACLTNEPMTFTRNIGMLLLAIYLILVGIIALAGGLAIPPVLTGVLALIAGIFILIGR
jgi:hypothetical protein